MITFFAAQIITDALLVLTLAISPALVALATSRAPREQAEIAAFLAAG